MFNYCSLEHMRKRELIDLILLMQGKETPRMPYEEYGDMHCYSCGGVVMLGENYCSICGQAIDWSECRWLSK